MDKCKGKLSAGDERRGMKRRWVCVCDEKERRKSWDELLIFILESCQEC